MAVLETTRSHSRGRFAELIARGIAAFAAWNQGRATRKALSQLTDRQLRDIGLVRGDIDFITK